MRYCLRVCLLVSLCLPGLTGAVQAQRGTIIVPNVEGISLELAGRLLRRSGLEPQSASAALSSLVIQQEPRPGLEVTQGSVVRLFTESTSQVASQPAGAVHITSKSSVPSSQSNIFSSPTVMVSGNTRPMEASMGGTLVLVSPQDTSGISVQAQPSIQGGTDQSVIFYEPVQPSLTPYFVQNRTPRFYPIWYPKQFIPANAPQSSVKAMIQGQHPVSPAQSQPASTSTIMITAPYSQPVPAATGTSSVLYFPSVSPGGGGQTSVLAVSPSRVGLIETSTLPAVAVPNVLRLPHQDAVAALTKAGLLTGAVLYVDSGQARSGDVVQQSPQARQLVQAGTQVQLWIAR